MTIDEFKEKYYLRFSKGKADGYYIISSDLILREDDKRVDGIQTKSRVTEVDNIIRYQSKLNFCYSLDIRRLF